MMARTLAAVAREVHGHLIGPDAAFGTVSIDSRRVDNGGLFVAIHGEHFDGNDFVDVQDLVELILNWGPCL